MELQAYKGYFENGNFYTAGKALHIPERRQIIITILDEHNSDNVSLEDALIDAQQQATLNGTSDMTLDDINSLIADCRQEKQGES